ncbi:MAG: MlaD family protein [Bacteroidales bacterium]|nr:MlaD family protein [Bacteroidales bacterium]MCF8398265.1 MlaD family protein [Bacteroidales bacterium]
MKYSRELVIGLMFLVALAILYWGYTFLKGMDAFSKERIFYGQYQKVDGLTRSNPVYINGMKVGLVKDLYFNPDMSGNIFVVMAVNNDFPIPKNSVARIYSSDLMGSKAVEINLGEAENLAQSGDTLFTSLEIGLKEEVNRQVQPLKAKAENLITSIDTMVTAIQVIFNENARENLISSFESIKSTFDNLQNTTYQVDTFLTSESNRLASIINNLNEVTMELRNNRESIGNTIENFSAISDSLAKADIPQTFASANKSLAELSEILRKINENEGTAGQLVNDKELYNKLVETADAMEALLKEVKENPKKFVKFSIF